MIGVVDVGGGMRGSYGAGVFDYCLDQKIDFDYCIGVSAGSANVYSYAAQQKGRNYYFYVDYSFRKEYMSLHNFIHTGSYLDLEYIYGTLSNTDGENPLDYQAIHDSKKIIKAVATDAKTGKPIYFSNEDIYKDDYGTIKGSSCVPVIDKPYQFKNRLLYDGGISDPIPFEKAFEEGCDKVVVILTKPRDYYRNPKNDIKISRLIQRKYPESAKKLADRGLLYNQQLDKAKEYEKEGKVLIVAPKDIGNMKTLTKDKGTIDKLYKDGYNDAKVIEDFVKGDAAC